ncbi:hypothetical protein [Sulfurimonas sp.]|uniref:hypothetical protein n=1 Tax=Sulfurimonas sp. TaxID=2022749 RepID=UPI002638BEF6|nr:hypothetical protein [Sulfurimonas sp.]MDD3856002.1 hypothetical protein [Sulfurimonas sp.]
MDTQINNISHVNLNSDSSVINNTGANIKTQHNFFLFELSPLFIKKLNDIYDVRKAIIRFATFIYMVVCFIALVTTLYIFKINGNDFSFDLIGTFLVSIIILIFYNIFNNNYYKEFVIYKKTEKIVFLLIFDFIIWGFLCYLIL